MLPSTARTVVRLADVLADCLRAVRGEGGALGLPGADRAAVILVDGLGAENLRARAGHARALASAMATKADVIRTGLPTTTAAALASLTTGTLPGEHGVVGYSALVPATGRVVNQLHGWDDGQLPAGWLRGGTLFHAARDASLRAFAIGADRYRDSGFTRAVLAGAEYLPARTIEDRFEALERLLADRSWRGIVYCYVSELDKAAHEHGWQSDQWGNALERVDGAFARLAAAMPPRTGAVLTADHGMVDVPPHARVEVPNDSALWQGVAHLGGEHRLLHLYASPDADPAGLAARWAEAVGDDAWAGTRDEALAADWFGPVAPEVAPRIGDVLVAARRGVAYYTEAALAGSAGRMVGQHGSWTDAETRVPLLRLGAFS
ncbi:MAG: alkaline phosphatase family protein [Microbacteriaceae bacterium]|nr:alkaline phosphatase family protein [Microbacteriaceae bacterium]